MIMSRSLAQFTIAAAVVALAAPAFAQQTPPSTSSSASTMALGYVGGFSGGGGLTFGGGVHFPLGERLVLATEAGYATGGEDFSGFGVDVDVHYVTVDANVHYQFSLSDDSRFTPYVLGGLGYLRASASASIGAFESSASSSTTGLNIGGGALWKIAEKWSVRPELKILVRDGSSTRFSAAFCYRFGS